MNVGAAASVARPGVEASAADPKLRRAAQDFEAILLGTWLKEVQESFASPEESAEAGSYRSLGIEAVGNALAASGGIGVAKMLMHQLAGAGKAGGDVP